MLPAALRLYRNAYKDLSKPMWWLALVILINRSGTMVVPFLTVYLTEQGYSLVQAGTVMAIGGTGGVLGGFLGGQLADRFGFHRVQWASLAASGLLFLLLQWLHSLVLIGGCVFLLSLAGEAFRPANATAIAHYSTDANRTRGYALNRLATNLGWAIGPATGGLLASIHFNLLFWVDGLTCLFAAALLYRVLPEGKQAAYQKQEGETGVSASPYRDGPFLKSLVCTFVVAVTFFQLMSIVPVYFHEGVGLSKAAIGAVLALNGLLIVLFEMVLVYTLEGRNRAVTCMIAGTLLMAAAYLLLGAGPYLGVVIASMVVITFGEMFLFPFLNRFWVDRSTAENRGRYAALFTMAFALGQLLAPPLGATIALHHGFQTLWPVNAALLTLAGAGFYGLQKHIRRYE
ncbi:MAG TPA: MFS transporter [Chitinophagaceae bacterium]|jgi:predicted MFS family arabinose efflux permease|nr:MFS transporter [Chitinophagaceae bacterium]